jgi:phage shock protein PspC (stress-responsive transcriptional regulator)
MRKALNSSYSLLEKQVFGVCAWWGDKLGISPSRIRLYFIYISFITLGSPLIVYLFTAFWLEHKSFFQLRIKKTIWDL